VTEPQAIIPVSLPIITVEASRIDIGDRHDDSGIQPTVIISVSSKMISSDSGSGGMNAEAR
jgi:hypothetical protein